VVDADSKEDRGVGVVEGLVVVAAVNGRLDHVDVDIELVAGDGNASYIGQSGAVGLVEGGCEVLDVRVQCPCEVVLEYCFTGFGAVAKGNDRGTRPRAGCPNQSRRRGNAIGKAPLVRGSVRRRRRLWWPRWRVGGSA